MKLRGAAFGLFLALGCTLAHVPAAYADKSEAPQADPATRDKSRAAFKKGVSQIKAQDWAGARASFEEAYSLFPHPSILLNLGMSRLKTDDPAGAEEALMKFLQEDSGAEAGELASARDALADARGKIGTIHLALTPATAKATIDGKPTDKTDVRVKAGSHAITIEAEGFQPADKQVDVPAKGTIDVQAVLAPKAGTETKPPSQGKTEEHVSTDDGSVRPIAGYALAGVAGVALIVTGVMGARALSLSSDYTDKAKPDTYGNPDTKSSGIAMRTGADVSFIIALLAGAGAVVLLFTDIGKSSDAPPSPGAAPKKDPEAKPAESPASREGRVHYSFPATLRW